jgi:hypothetical protein
MKRCSDYGSHKLLNGRQALLIILGIIALVLLVAKANSRPQIHPTGSATTVRGAILFY